MRTLLPLLMFGAAVAGLAAAPVRAETLPPCAVGLHLPMAGGLNYPGTIIEHDSARNSYLVRWDGSSNTEWLPPNMLKNSCIASAGGATAINWFYGYWTDNMERGPVLYIGADGSYQWAILGGDVIRGSWRKASAADLRTGDIGVVLLEGKDGEDWVAESQGVDNTNGERVLVTRSDGSEYQYVYRLE